MLFLAYEFMAVVSAVAALVLYLTARKPVCGETRFYKLSILVIFIGAMASEIRVDEHRTVTWSQAVFLIGIMLHLIFDAWMRCIKKKPCP